LPHDVDGRRRQRPRRRASVECDPSCSRMAAAFLGAGCDEYETLIVFSTRKQGCIPQAQRGFSGYDFGVRNSDIVVACKQALKWQIRPYYTIDVFSYF